VVATTHCIAHASRLVCVNDEETPMKNARSIAVGMAAILTVVQPVLAQPNTAGKIVSLFADPGDFVIELDTRGRCGSAYFHVPRANANFKELTALALTAFSTGKTMTLYVASCSGDRNVLSHGAVHR
jgi:hypothetical protein